MSTLQWSWMDQGGKMKLSVFILTKNEGPQLKKAFEQFAVLADEIIAIDFGSTDSTIDILNSFHATVIPTVWENDLAKAKNTALSYITGDWIIEANIGAKLVYENNLTPSAFKNSLAEISTKYDRVFTQTLIETKGNTEIGPYKLTFFRNNVYRYRGNYPCVPTPINAYSECLLIKNPYLLYVDDKRTELNKTSESDIAVIQLYENGEWQNLIYIGPDRSGGRFDDFSGNLKVNLYDLRIKYYSTNEREY